MMLVIRQYKLMHQLVQSTLIPPHLVTGGRESKDKYIQPSRDDREKTERNPDQKDQTKDHTNVDSTLISESSIQLQKQSSEIGNEPIIEAAKREYAVRYVNTESIPTCTTSVFEYSKLGRQFCRVL